MEPTLPPPAPLSAPAAPAPVVVVVTPEQHGWRWGLAHMSARTPLLMKRLGRGLIAFSAFAGGSQMNAGNEKVALAIFAAGGLGWFLTGLFTDEALPAMAQVVSSPAQELVGALTGDAAGVQTPPVVEPAVNPLG